MQKSSEIKGQLTHWLPNAFYTIKKQDGKIIEFQYLGFMEGFDIPLVKLNSEIVPITNATK